MNKQVIKSYRILNLEGAWFDYKKNEDKNEKDEFTFSTTEDRRFKNKDKVIIIKPTIDKLFSATMPYSLESIRAFKKYPDEVLDNELKIASPEYIGEDKKELFTTLFVNFKFNKALFDDTEAEINESEISEEVEKSDENTKTKNPNKKDNKINKKKLRKLIYTSTVLIDGVEYRFFKRGASKARTANVIFCKADYCDILLKPSLLGLEFKENELYDITSKEAYTSLIMSGIIGTLEINSDEILIIDDLTSPSFPARQTKTIMNEDGTVEQIEDDYMISNNMTDGEGLMDVSLFSHNKTIAKSTCALLRNDFLKCNAVRTRLQGYYQKHKITKVWDMFRGWMDASKIKLVITPSSCKFLKFANHEMFGGDKAKCFEHWLNNIPTTYGVVKTDHVGNYGYSNRLSYQMINSMNLSKESTKSLMQDELDYLKLLKDNTLVTSEELRKFNKKDKQTNRAERNEMSYFLDSLKTKEELSTGEMINDLLHRNSNYRFTPEFKDWKSKQIQAYIDELRLGKIRIQNSLYAIIVSCPYEMLVATTKENNEIDSCIMTGWECYNPNFDNGAELLAIRNPQINEGNICCLTNTYHDEYKWFGYQEKDENGNMVHKHDFVSFVNTWDCDIMDRGQGLDFDIDSMYFSDNQLLVQKSKDAQKYSTPVNGIEGRSELRKYNQKSLSELDSYLGGSTMSIGKIVNKSAIFNAYMYNAINKGYSDEYINACYEASSTLSSLSQISIDMAKKDFVDAEGNPLSLIKIMNSLNKTTYKTKDGKDVQILNFEEIQVEDKKTGEDKTQNHMIVPYFFKYTAKDNSYRVPTPMDCGMDYLEKILDEFKTKAMATDKISVADLINLENFEGRAKSSKIDEVREIINQCSASLNKNIIEELDSDDEKKRKKNFRRYIKKEAIRKLIDLNLNDKTVQKIIFRTFNLDKKYKGKEIKILDKDNNDIHYIDKKTGEDKILIVKELNELHSLVLTLLYNSYRETFMKCFKEDKLIENELEEYWK